MTDHSETHGDWMEQRVWDDDDEAWRVPTIRCPKCKGRLVYNGNYYCPRTTRSGKVCWALGDGRLTAFGRALVTDFCGWTLP